MAKIAVFRGKNIKELINDVNEFIKDKRIIDMKHEVTFAQDSVNRLSGPFIGAFYDTITFLYEEDTKPDTESKKPTSVPNDTCRYCPNGPLKEYCTVKNCIFGVKQGGKNMAALDNFLCKYDAPFDIDEVIGIGYLGEELK